MEANLKDLTFRLDWKTGAIFTQDEPGVGGEGVTPLTKDASRSAV